MGIFIVINFSYKIAEYRREEAVVIACEEKYFQFSSAYAGRYSYARVAQTKSGSLIRDNAFGAKSFCAGSIGKKVQVLVNPDANDKGEILSFFGFWFPPILVVIISFLATYKSIKRFAKN